MDTWLKPLVYALTALGLLPFVLTHLLFSSARFDSEKTHLKKAFLPGLLLNLLGNAAAGYVIAAFLFHTRRPWTPLKRILRLEGAWPEVVRLAVLAASCAVVGVLLGLVLRRLLLRKDRAPVSEGRRAAALLLCAICGALTFFACCEAVRNNQRVSLSEVCRKTAVYVIDPNQEEDLGDSGREISYVILSNPTPLDCVFGSLFLSESEKDLTALRFRSVTVPAHGTCRLTMDYEHGLDLKKGGGTTVWLSLREDTVLDQVKVPALREHEALRVSVSGEEEVHSYLPVVSRTLEPPVFSRLSGFYPESFDLTLSAPEGLEIRYSLDGSDPAENGLRYTGPLRIEDPTPLENVWSARTDTSASFVTEDPEYTVPDQPVDKCAIVSAVCIDAEGNRSPVATSSYYISYENREGYDNLGFVSVVTDPANLFDEETGIYVLGNVFETKHSSDREDLNWIWWSANYHQKGRAWEREASVQFFDAEKHLQFSSPLGIRIKGGASAGKLPKGLNLYARKDYSGSARFGTDFFGDGYNPKRLSLSAGGNDVNLKVRDWLTSRLLEDQDISLTRNRFLPYCVFLNGEYWGNYWLIEQYDAVYFAYFYGLNEGNVVVLKNNSLNAGIDEDKKLFNELLHFVRQKDLSKSKNYKAFCNLVDIDDFVAYYALQMYVANHDRGLRKNAALWRAREPENVPAGDTRWRWALFDVNSPSCYGDASSDTLTYMQEKDELFKCLLTSPEFSSAFYNMLKRLATEVFTPERAEQALSEFTSLMEKPLALEHQRFNRNITNLNALNKIRTFIQDRQTYILDLCTEVDLGGDRKAFQDASSSGKE